MTDRPYPIVEERTLPPVRRRMGVFPGRRDRSELPELRPGTALVFKVDDRYQTFLGGHHLNGGEAEVVDAVSVTVVDVRRDHLLRVAIDLPSASPADSFRAEVTFMCTVDDPVAVAREGLEDPAAYLAAVLRRQIRTLGQRFNANDVDHLNELRDEVTARVTAECQVRPPQLEGITVVLADVDLHAPPGLVEFEQKKRDQTRLQELERLAKTFNREQAALYEEIRRRGAIAMEALAQQLGEVTAAESASRAFDIEERQEQRSADALGVLAERGHLDRVPLDAQHLITRLVNSVAGTGHAAPTGTADALGGAARQAIGTGDEGTAEPERSDDDDEPLDEDDT